MMDIVEDGAAGIVVSSFEWAPWEWLGRYEFKELEIYLSEEGGASGRMGSLLWTVPANLLAGDFSTVCIRLTAVLEILKYFESGLSGRNCLVWINNTALVKMCNKWTGPRDTIANFRALESWVVAHRVILRFAISFTMLTWLEDMASWGGAVCDIPPYVVS